MILNQRFFKCFNYIVKTAEVKFIISVHRVFIQVSSRQDVSHYSTISNECTQ